MDAAQLAAMYQDDAQPREVAVAAGYGKTRRIRVGVVEYEVPTVDSVRHLEQVIQQQAQMIARQQQELAQLRHDISMLRSRSRGSRVAFVP